VTGRLLTARELAGLLEVSTETVLRWTRRGELPAIRLPGGAIRYRETDLDAWLEARETAGDATRGVSPAPDTTRRRDDATVRGSPVPLDMRLRPARTEEDP
jgi:excisionase family DNA binding protein